jgi:glycine/D-amino acid oxidase-like deaminating enzyme
MDAVQMGAWCGFRPVSPDGIPIVSATPLEGLWINAGHGTLGWTLCAGSANLLVGMINGAPRLPQLSLGRFSAKELLNAGPVGAEIGPTSAVPLPSQGQ